MTTEKSLPPVILYPLPEIPVRTVEDGTGAGQPCL